MGCILSESHLSRGWSNVCFVHLPFDGSGVACIVQVLGYAATPLEWRRANWRAKESLCSHEAGSNRQVFGSERKAFNACVWFDIHRKSLTTGYFVHVVICWCTRHVHFLGSPLLCPVTWISMVRSPVDWHVSRFRFGARNTKYCKLAPFLIIALNL